MIDNEQGCEHGHIGACTQCEDEADVRALHKRIAALEAENDNLRSWHAWLFDRLNEAACAHFLEQEFHGNLTQDVNRTKVVQLLTGLVERISGNYSRALKAERERDELVADRSELKAWGHRWRERALKAERERDEAEQLVTELAPMADYEDTVPEDWYERREKVIARVAARKAGIGATATMGKGGFGVEVHP